MSKELLTKAHAEVDRLRAEVARLTTARDEALRLMYQSAQAAATVGTRYDRLAEAGIALLRVHSYSRCGVTNCTHAACRMFDAIAEHEGAA